MLGYLGLCGFLVLFRPLFYYWQIEVCGALLYVAIFMFAFGVKDYTDDSSPLVSGLGFFFTFVFEIAYLYSCIEGGQVDCRLRPSGYILWVGAQWFQALTFLFLLSRGDPRLTFGRVAVACAILALALFGVFYFLPLQAFFAEPRNRLAYIILNSLGFVGFYAFLLRKVLKDGQERPPFVVRRSVVAYGFSLVGLLGILWGLADLGLPGFWLYYFRFLAIFLCYNTTVTFTILTPYRSLYLRLVERADQLSAVNADLEITLVDKEALLEEKNALLAQREALLREVHHRVKNNLQIATSILSLQSSHSPDPALRRALDESQNRLRAMASVHELLYREQNFGSIDFSRYLDRVTADLFHASGRPGITRVLACESILLPLELAIPCGLIVNELVTNCLRHAFPQGETGQVRLALGRVGEFVELSVEDDGVGLPGSFEALGSDSLGFSLIRGLVAQVSGVLEVRGGGGTRIALRLPLATQGP